MAMRVCVVGSGPAGMYASKYLLRSALGQRLRVDVVERLPACYGLVRYGVAPDHPEVKSVSNDFDEVLADPRVRLFANVEVGKHVQVAQLVDNYDAVLLAYGASSDRALGIPGEAEAGNVWGARDFVNWYNGHPDMAERAPPMLDCEEAAIVGQGNVALDCARILTKPVDELAKTDISSQALEVLSQSKLRRVSVLGRRGAAQAAFTIKEMRELTKIDGVGCAIDPAELEAGRTPASQEEAKERAKRRINDLLEKTAGGFEAALREPRVAHLRFLVSPTSVHSGPDGRVTGLTLQRNALTGPAGAQRAEPVEGALEELSCGLLVRSIGYKSQALPGVPFDEKRNTASNTAGRVEGVPGLYVAGWLKRGPSGIIGTNIPDARETVDNIVEDLSASPGAREGADLADLLPADCEPVDRAGYAKLDAFEQSRGAAMQPQRPRDKLVLWGEMLRATR